MTGFTNAERLSLYAHLRTYESDFDKSQSQLRTIAAAWSGGIIGAVALTTVAIATTGLSPSRATAEEIAAARVLLFYVREVICVAGSLGIFAFWYVDQSVYQRLLHSAFAYGLHVEYENPDLPQVRTNVYWANLDITGHLGMFYRMQFWAFVILAGAFLALPHDPLAHPGDCTPLVLYGIYAAFAFFLETRSWNWASLEKMVKRLYPTTLSPNLPRRGATENDPVGRAWVERMRAHPVRLTDEVAGTGT
jgi:hypothetical protein